MKKRIFVMTIGLIFIFRTLHCAVATTYHESLQAANQNIQNKRSIATSDPTRPIYHLQSPSCWINDPCGMFYFNSSFHVFFQTNPWGSQWGNMSWSQVVSDPDQKWNFKWFYPETKTGKLTTVSIIPSLNPNSPDKNGIFTGSVKLLPFPEKNKNNKTVIHYYPAAFYTGVWGNGEDTQEVVCMARALNADKIDKNGNFIDPYLTEWTKYSTTSEKEPNSYPDIIIRQPGSLQLTSFRDPYLFQLPDDSNYYMLIAGGIKNNPPEGVILIYKNDGNDLRKNWKRVNKNTDFFFSGPVAVKNNITNRGDFESPVLYRLTDNIGTTNETPYILIFGQDGPPEQPYGKSSYYILGNIIKTKNGIQFAPLENFQNSNGKPIYKHLDLNPNFIFYAANTINVDNEQRNYLIGWLNIASQSIGSKDYSWAGMLSIPRFLFAYKNNNKWELGQESILINALRGKKLYDSTISFTKDTTIILSGVTGRHLNIEAVFKNKKITSCFFGLKIACNKNKCADIKINKGKLSVNNGSPIDLKLPANSSELGINIYLDGSSLEIFITREINNTLIPYSVYSAPLENNGNPNNETVKVYGSNGISASITAYSMNTCWTNQPAADKYTQED